MSTPSKILAAFRTNVEPSDPAQATGSLMWMPQGLHPIKAATRDGTPVQALVSVTADLVPALDSALKAQLAAAEKGEGSKPFFDFNHDEEEASAWPTAFRWVEGKGIFADVEWSDRGKSAVAGKAYRYFSPAFYLGQDENAGRPFLLPDLFCLGGLVNAPAFQRIQQVAAVAAKHAVAAGRVTTLETELTAAKTENATLRADLGKAAMQAALARVDADLVETDHVSAEVRASLAKNLLSDPTGAPALIASVRAAHRRQTAVYLGANGAFSATSAQPPSDPAYAAYMAKLNKSRS